MLPGNLIHVDEPSRVGEVRRTAETVASREGLSEAAASRLAIIATEMAGNVLKHAGGGEVQISGVSSFGAAGVEVRAVDRGPGMADVGRCFEDGYSSAGTPGTGLGAVARLSSEFDVYSQPSKGTVLMARVLAGEPAHDRPVIGAVVVPLRGEAVSGDAWGIRVNGGGGLVLMLADGLGHGLLAADASGTATGAFERQSDLAPVAALEGVHRALRGTRGAAVAVAYINPQQRTVRYAGLGNIAGAIVGGSRTQFMVSHNGTAGHEAYRLQEFQYDLPDDALVILHTDGLTANWNFRSYPGLAARHPAVIAGVLYRDAGRRRDDAGIVVVRVRPQ